MHAYTIGAGSNSYHSRVISSSVVGVLLINSSYVDRCGWFSFTIMAETDENENENEEEKEEEAAKDEQVCASCVSAETAA